MSGLRVALLDHGEGAYSRQLEAALRAAGHEPRLFGALALPGVEALLRRRGFTPALSHVPRAAIALMRGDFDLAHAFTAADASAVLAWRRLRARPTVFTCTEQVDRATVADRRLRLSALACAIEESDALVAANEAVSTSVERWFACSPAVLVATDAPGHERLYRELLA